MKKQKENGEKSHLIPIVVIGTSAGGLNALNELVSQFDEDYHAAVFIVMHLSNATIGDFLVIRLQRNTHYRCILARDGMPVEPDTIYIAPPDRHLLLSKNKIVIGHGPAENRWRPSIDALFRSAAAHFSSRVTGIVLTGLLDDGTAGMSAIKRSGGITIVQDPNEAEFPDMPVAVMNNMQVDYCLKLAEMGDVLKKIAAVKSEPVAVPDDVIAEARLSERNVIGIDEVSRLGESSLFVCPDCGGHLWEITKDKMHRYRCHTGHVYTEEDLSLKQQENQEAALWVAIRIMEERRNLMLKINGAYSARGLKHAATGYSKKADELKNHIEKLRELLFTTQKE